MYFGILWIAGDLRLVRRGHLELVVIGAVSLPAVLSQNTIQTARVAAATIAAAALATNTLYVKQIFLQTGIQAAVVAIDERGVLVRRVFQVISPEVRWRCVFAVYVF